MKLFFKFAFIILLFYVQSLFPFDPQAKIHIFGTYHYLNLIFLKIFPFLLITSLFWFACSPNPSNYGKLFIPSCLTLTLFKILMNYSSMSSLQAYTFLILAFLFFAIILYFADPNQKLTRKIFLRLQQIADIKENKL